ncbi:MAG TPA: protein kinase [Gemmatimonadaceae bacterium]|nr:protein kinase [Gemmatimonadaceae bacterium]
MADGKQQQSTTELQRKLEASLGDVYAFERELGGAGMSRVFVAVDRSLERQVVVKVLRPEMSAGVSVDRFRREIQLAAKLQHPHIVPLLSSGEIDASPYFTMPFIEGESLRDKLARDGALSVGETVRIMRQVAAALSYAHKQGIVHRDIKPDNVMLTDEFALVTDFGVAKALSASAGNESSPDITASGLTGLGLAIGTPAYMAPEQAVADPNVDHRADIYSLGTMAYEMLTGLPPFSKMSAQATLAAQAVEQPIPIQTKRPGLPDPLATLIMRCLEKRPADRPQTAGEVQQELDAITSGAIRTNATLTPATPPATTAEISTSRFPKAAVAGIALLLLLAIGFGLYQRGKTNSASGSGGELSSVAVLPLVNLGGDSTDDYFSDGMTDELANALGKLPGLRVASRTSTYAFKARKDANVGDIGRTLHVQAVLEGTVRRAGDRLRVSAQLTNVSDGLALWSDTYEREAKDVFQVQDDIAKQISEALKLKLGARAAAVSSTSHGTDNLQAYDLYLRGIYFFNARGGANLQRSISYFEQAVSADPNFGRAYAAMAMAYALLPEYTDSPPPDVLDKTKNASSRALAIDSTLAEAHTALGLASVHAWDYETARRQYQMALALAPRFATAHQWYGELLYHVGKVDSAIAQIRTAKTLDPLAPIVNGALGFALYLAGQYDTCLSELRNGLELAPQMGLLHSMLGFCQARKGDGAAAVRSGETALRLDANYSVRQGQLAYIYGITGQKEKAGQLLVILKQRAQNEPAQWFPLGMAQLSVGDKDAALSALERAVNGHEIGLSEFSLLNDKMWDLLRPDPRFQRILQRMNLTRYQKQPTT